MNPFKHWRWLVALGAVFVPAAALGAVTIPFTFQPNTLIRASEVNSNFAALKTAVDQLQATAPGLSVTSAVTHVTGAQGASITSIPESALAPLPAGATVRRPMILNSILKTNDGFFIRVLNAYIEPTPVSGSYSVAVTDPTTGTWYVPSGTNVVHIDVASFFSR